MNRWIRLLSRAAFFVLMFAAVTLACGCEDTAAIQRDVARAQAHYQPIITALEKYREEHDRYPDTLQHLVRAGLLRQIPEPLVFTNATDPHGQPVYKTQDGGRQFTLSFWYYFHNQGGFGMGDTTYATWSSSDRQWKMEGPGY